LLGLWPTDASSHMAELPGFMVAQYRQEFFRHVDVSTKETRRGGH
jgi:hypothetical protein